MIVFSLCNTATPFGFTFQGKPYRAIIQRTTPAVFIHNFHLKQSHIRSVRMKTFRVLHSGKFQASGFARCEQCITAYLLTFSVITYRFQFTRLISYLIESEKKMIRTFSLRELRVSFGETVSILRRNRGFTSR